MGLSLELFPVDLLNSIFSWIDERNLFSAAQVCTKWNKTVTDSYKDRCQKEIIQFKKILGESIQGAHLPTSKNVEALIDGLPVFFIDANLPNNRRQKEMQCIRLLFNKIFVPVEASFSKSSERKITELELFKIKKQLDKDLNSDLTVKNQTEFICPATNLKDVHFWDQGSYTWSKMLPKYFPKDWFAGQPSKIAFLLRGKLILFTCTYTQDESPASKMISPFEFYIQERDESDLMESNADRKINSENGEYKLFLLGDKKTEKTFPFLSSLIFTRLSKEMRDPANGEIFSSLYQKNLVQLSNSKVFVDCNKEFVRQILFRLGEKETVFIILFNEKEREEKLSCCFSKKIGGLIDLFGSRRQPFAQLCAEIYFLTSDHLNHFEKKVRALHNPLSRLQALLLHLKLNAYRGNEIYENIFRKLAKVERIAIMDLYYLFEAGDFYMNLSKRRGRSPSSAELSEIYQSFFANPSLFKEYDKIEETIKTFFKMNPVSESP